MRLCLNTAQVKFVCITLRHSAYAAELPTWPIHPKPVGCEPYGTTAVYLPARAGPVFLLELDDARFVSSLVRLRSLDLSDCSEQLDDVTPLSSLISLNCLSLGKRNDVVFLVSQLVDLSPLSSLVALKTLHLVRCGNVSDLLPLLTLTS